jgi:ectoine hydroxylase
MELTREQLADYRARGFVFLTGALPAASIDGIKQEVQAKLRGDRPGVVMEDGGSTVRSVYGSHTESQVLFDLCRDPHLLGPATQIVAPEVYIYQFKINVKAAFDGDVWEWHQDYVFWREEDGLAAPAVTTAAIFVDEVTEFNGPLMFIPGSHMRGVLESTSGDSADGGGALPWSGDVSARLKFTPSRATIASLVRAHGIDAPKGPPGSILFFDGNIVHGSSSNMSPFGRAMILITYNSVANPPAHGERRPDFLVARDRTPLVPAYA